MQGVDTRSRGLFTRGCSPRIIPDFKRNIQPTMRHKTEWSWKYENEKQTLLVLVVCFNVIETQHGLMPSLAKNSYVHSKAGQIYVVCFLKKVIYFIQP